MSRRYQLNTAFAATVAALALLVLAVIAALVSRPEASQEQFEFVRPAGQYAADLLAAGPGLRTVLFLDSLFMLAYATAIGFVCLAFTRNGRPAAWIGGVGILCVLLLDALENATMVQSLDIASLAGGLTAERIAFQAAVSAMKWQVAAAALLAVSFVLPGGTVAERLLVWGVRLGLPVAVPLFVHDPFGLRPLGGLLLLVSMAGGFALLALVLRPHARSA